MFPNIVIQPKQAAKEAARAAAAETRAPTDALVLDVYCDASYKTGFHKRINKPRAGIGIVVNVWLPRGSTSHRTSRACFIPCNDRDDNNNTAEAFALAEGAHVALDQIASIEERAAIRATDGINIIFWSDSAKVLRALEDRRQKTHRSKRMRHILDIIKLKTLELQDLRGNVSVQFCWCPAECVEPHETADELSKRVRISGGSTPSKALALFRRVPHSSIQSVLEEAHKDASEGTHRYASEETDTDASEDTHTDASENEADKRLETSVSDLPDPYACIQTAALQLPAREKKVILTAIELQKMVNESRAENEARGQVQDSGQHDYEYEDMDGHEGLDEREDQSVKHEGQSNDNEGRHHDQDGFFDGNEEQLHQAQGNEPGDNEDGDADDEPRIAGDREAPPNRMRALWNWVRRPRHL